METQKDANEREEVLTADDSDERGWQVSPSEVPSPNRS